VPAINANATSTVAPWPGSVASASAYRNELAWHRSILMVAALSVMGMENIHEMNALKTPLASRINGIAVVTFIAAGAVFWPEALVMIVGSVAGGYGGAHFARRLDPRLVRRFVTVVGFGMTIYFFVRG